MKHVDPLLQGRPSLQTAYLTIWTCEDRLFLSILHAAQVSWPPILPYKRCEVASAKLLSLVVLRSITGIQPENP